MKKIQPFYDLILGFLYLLFTILEYFPCFNKADAYHLADWCFVTGILGGVYFIISGLLFLKNKESSTFLHFFNTTELSIIFVGTFTIGLNVSGYLWFIHIIGPVLVLFRFFMYCDCLKITHPFSVLLLGIAPVTYVIFTLILLITTHECPFPAKMLFYYENNLIPYGLTLLLVMVNVGLGYIFYFINRGINKKRNKKENAK